MNEFGTLLRDFRESYRDPLFPARKLSQVRLGELLGGKLGIQGYSGAAVCDWENGKNKIHADDRLVLTALIQVLIECGGLKTMENANQLLNAGNYRALDAGETQKVFGETGGETKEKKIESPVPLKELQRLISQAREGPRPAWPRVLATLMRWGMDHISISVTTIFWVWIWLGAWWLVGPSLRWPFGDRESAFRAVGMFVSGTLIVPLCIGLLVNTKDNEYWKQQNGINTFRLRLFTYQGAAIGFTLGYFLVFPFVLVRYYLRLESALWLELAAVTTSLILGNMAAHVVPHNLWRAYGRLTLRDGGIFLLLPCWVHCGDSFFWSSIPSSLHLFGGQW